MKKIKVFFTGTILLGVLFAATAFKPSTTTGGGSANGQGTTSLLAEKIRHFSFHANTLPNGSVKGNGVLTYTGGEFKLKFDIDCITVVGNTAQMSGTITKDDVNPARVGWKCIFTVEDNGEGSNATADRISLLFSAPSLPSCSTAFGLGLNPIEGGNIQVKP